jgi:hypothetical protein
MMGRPGEIPSFPGFEKESGLEHWIFSQKLPGL